MRLNVTLASALLLLASAAGSASAHEQNAHGKSDAGAQFEGSAETSETSETDLQTAMQVQQQQIEQLQLQVTDLQERVQAALPASEADPAAANVADPASVEEPTEPSRNNRCSQLRFGSNWQALALAARTCR
jgi:TolA-binding protein